MSKQLKRDGFRFVGSTICYAFMQSAGLVDDHVVSCFRASLHSVFPRHRVMNRSVAKTIFRAPRWLWPPFSLSGIALVVASLVRSDLNVLQNSLSYYAIGPWGALQSTAFIALGVTRRCRWRSLCDRPSHRLSQSALCSLMLSVTGVSSLCLVILPNGFDRAGDHSGRRASNRWHDRRSRAARGRSRLHRRDEG